MSGNPLTEKIIAPYVRAIFDFAIKAGVLHQVTDDFNQLGLFFDENSELAEYLNNPIVSQKAKREVLVKVFKPQLDDVTFKFIMLLVDRDRINYLPAVAHSYMELIYQTALIKKVELSTASEFTDSQKDALVEKLKKLIDAREIRLKTTVDPTLIGGFSIKTESKVIDFSVKNLLQELAKHLDTVLKI